MATPTPTPVPSKPTAGETRELDEITTKFLADVSAESARKQQQAAAEAAVPYANQQQAALQLYIRREKLEGAWVLLPDGKTIRRES